MLTREDGIIGSVNDSAEPTRNTSNRRDRSVIRARVAATIGWIAAVTMLVLFIAFAQRLADVTVERDQFARAAGRSLSELELYEAPANPNTAQVAIEGRWRVAWADEPDTCTGFDSEASCRMQRVLRVISTSEAETLGVRVTGGPLSSSNLDHRMTGVESTIYFCNERANTTTHELTFRITGADLVGGVIEATRIEGQLTVTTESDSCIDGTVQWRFTATRDA